MKYEDFVKDKQVLIKSSGIFVKRSDLNAKMFDFQKDIVRWALAKGRSAIFADCGLGKTLMQLEWAQKIVENTKQSVLIVAPLSVSYQTQKEGEKFGYVVNVCTSQNDVKYGINITNYEKLDKFVANEFGGVVLDESSILKSFSGKIRNQMITMFCNVPFKLCCTATPAPNDYMELGNHSEFLGVMTRSEMLSMFFVHDGGDTSKWRLKGHAQGVFWEWMASWSVFINNPENLGYNDNGYVLPKLRVNEIVVDGDEPINIKLSLTERREARRESLQARCEAAANLVNNSNSQWLVWCDLNAESELLCKLIKKSRDVKGSDDVLYKQKCMDAFTNKRLKCLISKPSIAGFGMNWQNCHNVIFVGLSDSYEQYYQAVRRCWRFGQKHSVNVYIIIAAKEGCVKQNIERKQKDALAMQNAMIELTKEITKKELRKTVRMIEKYNAERKIILPKWSECEK